MDYDPYEDDFIIAAIESEREESPGDNMGCAPLFLVIFLLLYIASGLGC